MKSVSPPDAADAPSYAVAPLRAFGWWRRLAALAIDVIIFAPIVLVLCVGGSFDTETTHRSWSWMYVMAPLVYPLAEIVLTRTPGVWILRGRFRTDDGRRARYAQLVKRGLWKWGPFVVFVPAYILTGVTVGETMTGFIVIPLLVLGL